MKVTFILRTPLGWESRRFRNIHTALTYSHNEKEDLYEDDEDGPSIVYRNAWDRPLRRAVWRALLSEGGLSPYDRRLLPQELKKGTFGPDFEVF